MTNSVAILALYVPHGIELRVVEFDSFQQSPSSTLALSSVRPVNLPLSPCITSALSQDVCRQEKA